MLNALRVAFKQNLNASVASVAHVPCQAMFGGGAVDEWAETDALNNTCNAEFNTQRWDLPLIQGYSVLLYVSKFGVGNVKIKRKCKCIG